MISDELVGVFKKEVKRLLKLYGLSSWEVNVETCRLHDDTTALVAPIYKARYATIMIDADHEESEASVKKSAMHEVLHLLFSDMREAYREQEGAEDTERAASAEHGVIHALVNAEYGDDE